MHRLIIAVAAVFLITSSAQAKISSALVMNNGKIIHKTINKRGNLIAFLKWKGVFYRCFLDHDTVQCSLLKDTALY